MMMVCFLSTMQALLEEKGAVCSKGKILSEPVLLPAQAALA
jgi:hypothetical protein